LQGKGGWATRSGSTLVFAKFSSFGKLHRFEPHEAMLIVMHNKFPFLGCFTPPPVFSSWQIIPFFVMASRPAPLKEDIYHRLACEPCSEFFSFSVHWLLPLRRFNLFLRVDVFNLKDY